MGDSFVDVTYRGLEVGRRLRIRDFGADTAYVEAPTPMPVGTSLEIATDAGVTIKAIVARVHEQVGGSDRAPGMNVRAIVVPEVRAWWDARMHESPAPAPAPIPVPVAPSSDRTAPASPESGPVVVESITDDGARTQVMAVIDPDELERGGNGEIVDDGKRTQMMSVAEIDEIVAQATASSDTTGESDITGEEDVSQDGPSTNGNGASKKKRRRKKK
ncbi:MAG TPA: hypothetical protein VL463_14085 [Kofleriaceae bacterium]|jgi:hypothetical protein|nr:hypothetical protein [Kofleriaceae bacterium]